MKKMFSVLVSFALIVALIPIFNLTASAVSISNAQELCAFRDDVNSGRVSSSADLFLTNDIDLTGINWEPIVNYYGNINGNGHKIKNLFIDPYEGYTNGGWQYFNSLNRVGFISHFEGGLIQDLTIEVSHVEGHQLIGAFAGETLAGSFLNCTVSASNKVWNMNDGVIIGVCAVGGITGAFGAGSGGPFNNYDNKGLIGESCTGYMMGCRVLYPVHIYTVKETVADKTYPYSVLMNHTAQQIGIDAYQNAPDYFCNNLRTLISYYLYPVDEYDIHGNYLGIESEEGYFTGGLAGVTFESRTVFVNCSNSAFVSGAYRAAGGIVGYTMTGAIIRGCQNDGYILGSDRSEVIFTSELQQYFCNNKYLQELPCYSIHHPEIPDYYLCNDGFGGIVGYCGADTLIEDCANTGPIESHKLTGGICGLILEAVTGTVYCKYTRITNSYNTGTICAHHQLEIGGIAASVSPYNANIGHTPQYPCPYCNAGNNSASVSGYCDNIIENCYNAGELLVVGGTAISFPSLINPQVITVFPLYFGEISDLSSFEYGGIAANNSGIIRNCYSTNEDGRTMVSICLNNSGIIDHCFGKSDYCQGTQPGTSNNGTSTGYGKFISGSNPSLDSFELVTPGTLSPGTELISEMNTWVDRNAYYEYSWQSRGDATFSYKYWTSGYQSNLSYDVFGNYSPIYKLTYDAAGGINPPSVQYGSGNVTVRNQQPTYQGHIFSYWQDGIRYNAGDPYYLFRDSTLTAVWDVGVTTYTLTYDANGGSGAPAQFTGFGNITLDMTNPVRNGYRFLGWHTSPTAVSPLYYAGGTYSYYLSQNATLYAVWEPVNTYTLTYDANGGSGAPAAQTGYGNITLSSTVPTRSGYNFGGWTATPLAVIPQTYQPGAAYNLTQNTTLYAYWYNASSLIASASVNESLVSRGSSLIWTVNTPDNVNWIKVTNTYTDSTGKDVTLNYLYKYSTYHDSEGETTVTDSGNARVWTLSVPATYTGTKDMVVQNWSLYSKASGSNDWKNIKINSESGNENESAEITVAKNLAVLNSLIEPSGTEPVYEPYTLYSVSTDKDTAEIGEYVLFYFNTTPDVSKIRITYTNAQGKTKSKTYQTSSTAIVDYSPGEDGSSVIWTVKYKITEPSADGVYTADCRGNAWGGAKTVTLYAG